MTNENMTARQIISVIILFVFGSSLIMGITTKTGQDSWIVTLIAIIMAVPLLLIYARIIKLYPGKGFYDIIEIILGKTMGKIMIVLVTIHGVHLGALVLRNFSEYISVSTLIKTPQIMVMIMIMLVAGYIGKSRIEVLGKWAILVLPSVLLVIIITIIFSLKDVDFTNLFPIMEHNPKELFMSSLEVLAFPFGEIVLLLPLAGYFNKKDNASKIYMTGLFIGGGFLFLTVMRNLLILGPGMMSASYFPAYTAVRIIEFGEFLTRTEGLITINFLLGGITKITVCIIAASKGVAKIIDIKEHRSFITPIILLMIMISIIIYSNMMEMFIFMEVWFIYSFPIQLIIPLIVWIIAEIKVKKMNMVEK